MAELSAFLDPDLETRQSDFALALLDPDRPLPAGVVGPDGQPSARRFAVYRNNVIAGLVEALRAGYPAVRRIVGEEFFTAMARLHAVRRPPTSPIMLEYGAGFAEFIDAFPPAMSLPYLGDVARLERAWMEAYHAAEARPIDPAALARIAPDRLPCLRFLLHPSLRLVRSSFPVMAIWRMNLEDGEPAPVALDGGGEELAVLRPSTEVELRVLPPGTVGFLAALSGGATILDAMTEAPPAAGLAATLAGLLEAEAIVGWQTAGDETDFTSRSFP